MIRHFLIWSNNKAGYTATSCGQVGRGGNARFHTFRLVVTDRRTDGRTDKGSYRVACPKLKTKNRSFLLKNMSLSQKGTHYFLDAVQRILRRVKPTQAIQSHPSHFDWKTGFLDWLLFTQWENFNWASIGMKRRKNMRICKKQEETTSIHLSRHTYRI